MQRAVDCKCGDHFEARNDSDLLDAFRRHVEAEHPEWGEAELKAHIITNAYDQVPEGSRA